MGILSWIVFGLLAGIVAKMLMPGPDPGGMILTTILGIVGGVVGGYIGSRLGWGEVTQWDLRSFALAVGGSVLLLFLHRALTGRRP